MERTVVNAVFMVLTMVFAAISIYLVIRIIIEKLTDQDIVRKISSYAAEQLENEGVTNYSISVNKEIVYDTLNTSLYSSIIIYEGINGKWYIQRTTYEATGNLFQYRVLCDSEPQVIGCAI